MARASEDCEFREGAKRFREVVEDARATEARIKLRREDLRRVAYLLIRGDLVRHVGDLRSMNGARHRDERIPKIVEEALRRLYSIVFEEAKQEVIERMRFPVDYLRKVLFPWAFRMGWR